MKKAEEVVVYKCLKCGSLYYTEKSAKNCSCDSIKRCEYCGCEIDKKSYYTVCDSCRDKREKKREQDRFRKSTKYTLDDCPKDKCIMMYSDVYGNNEGYFTEVEDLLDYCSENEINVPKYIWCTNCRRISIDAYGTIESACDELCEDAIDTIKDVDIKELQDFIDEWCNKQTGTDTYEVDYNNCIILD